ncbi:hypothetical protein CDL12_18939 [Handroanthus impetiginosus]|uniref:Protein TIFY n=1 Tax=Handroanthus impetiginosus TaxID=429701 RepID=A0A2G9GTA2_9LAMI|nr:hypothetical protein CDL12_18939 [Handroanthus impetiginosus]
MKRISKEGTTTADSKTSPLTIFYSGRVLVFNDYPAEKAKELVAFAKKGSSQMSYGIWSNTLQGKPSPPAPASAASAQEGLPPRPQASTSANGVGISSNTCKEGRNSKAEEKANCSGN